MTDNLLNKNAGLIQQRWPSFYETIANNESISMDVCVKGPTLNINEI